jgi:hypothetical protein
MELSNKEKLDLYHKIKTDPEVIENCRKKIYNILYQIYLLSCDTDINFIKKYKGKTLSEGGSRIEAFLSNCSDDIAQMIEAAAGLNIDFLESEDPSERTDRSEILDL